MAQSKQAVDALIAEYLPAKQRRQLSEEVDPSTAENVPAEHPVHAVEDRSELYLPELQRSSCDFQILSRFACKACSVGPGTRYRRILAFRTKKTDGRGCCSLKRRILACLTARAFPVAHRCFVLAL